MTDTNVRALLETIFKHHQSNPMRPLFGTGTEPTPSRASLSSKAKDVDWLQKDIPEGAKKWGDTEGLQRLGMFYEAVDWTLAQWGKERSELRLFLTTEQLTLCALEAHALEVSHRSGFPRPIIELERNAQSFSWQVLVFGIKLGTSVLDRLMPDPEGLAHAVHSTIRTIIPSEELWVYDWRTQRGTLKGVGPTELIYPPPPSPVRRNRAVGR